MITMAKGQLELAGAHALDALGRGDLVAYDRWSQVASRLADDLAREPGTARRCRCCSSAMARPIAVPQTVCAACRAVGGSW